MSIVDDVNLLSPQTRTSQPLPLGPLTASDIRGLEGEAERSSFVFIGYCRGTLGARC